MAGLRRRQGERALQRPAARRRRVLCHAAAHGGASAARVLRAVARQHRHGVPGPAHRTRLGLLPRPGSRTAPARAGAGDDVAVPSPPEPPGGAARCLRPRGPRAVPRGGDPHPLARRQAVPGPVARLRRPLGPEPEPGDGASGVARRLHRLERCYSLACESSAVLGERRPVRQLRRCGQWRWRRHGACLPDTCRVVGYLQLVAERERRFAAAGGGGAPGPEHELLGEEHLHRLAPGRGCRGQRRRG
mmetsp:Transcript_76567/g.200873  ORF Transcript_76567/g.200873 Transcript_76567/m.200873 type:complete len:246 (-) Transcript_76567:688-1425(-)